MTTTNTFIVYFSEKTGIQDLKKIVRLRQFVENGLGSEINCIENIVFLVKQKYCALLIAETDSKVILEQAIEPCHDAFQTEVVEISNYYFNPKVKSSNHCITVLKSKENRIDSFSLNDDPSFPNCVRFQTEFPDGSPYSGLWLLNTPEFIDALEFGDNMHPNDQTVSMEVASMKDYYENLKEESEKEVVQQEPTTDAQDTTTKGTIINMDSTTAYYADSNIKGSDYQTLINERTSAKTRDSNTVNPNIYFWENDNGNLQIYHYWVENIYPDGEQPHITPKNYTTKAILPVHVSSIAPGNTLAFNLTENSFQIISELHTWLHDILNTSKYDQPWPEDNYKGDKLKAYNFIIKALKEQGINTLPKKGKIKPGIIEAILYPQNADFPEASFDSVKTHLLYETAFFQYSEDWFGLNGIFHVLNNTISILGEDDLTAAANLMKIPPKKSTMTLILDAIFGDIIAIIGAIPDVGGPISAVLSIAWSTAKLVIGSNHANNPIEESIANMANVLNTYLETVIATTETHHQRVNCNWGRLREFALGVINGKISSDQFGVDENNPSSPKGYINAMTKAWKVIIYKSLLQDRHRVHCSISLSTKNPPNHFDPQKGKFSYTYYLSGKYYDSSGKVKTGAIIIHCKCKAPSAVLNDLFNPQNLDQNPLEFFLGINGWPPVVPVYRSSGYTEAEPRVPIISIN